MATVIDALMVTLGLDATGFKKGVADSERTTEGFRKTVQRAGDTEQETSKRWTKGAKENADLRKKHHEAATKQFKEQNEQGKQLAQGLNNIKTELLAMLAAFTGGKGLTEFFAGTIMGNAALGRQANLFGITAQAMSNWQGVAEAMGGTADDANRSLGAVNDILTELEEHGGTIGGEKGAILRGMGLSKEDFDTVDHGMENIATKGIARLRAMGRTDREIAAELGKLGISGPVASAMLDRTRGIKEQLAIQQQLNPVTAEETRQAEDAVTAWSNLHRQMDRVGTQITTALMPALNMIIGGLSAMVKWASANPGAATALFTALTVGVTGLGLAIAALGLESLVAESEMLPFILIALAIIAALAGIVIVIQDVISYFKTGKSLIDWGPFVPAFLRIKAALLGIKSAIQPIIELAKQFWAHWGPPIMKAVGQALLNFIVAPFQQLADILTLILDVIRTLVDVFRGDFAAAARDGAAALGDALRLAARAAGFHIGGDTGFAGQGQGSDTGAAATGAAPASGGGGGGVPAKTAQDRAGLIAMIRQKANAAGLNPDYMVNLAYSESGLNPNASGGLFGLIARWNPGVDIHDPVASADRAMAIAKSSMAAEARAGFAYTPGDEKMAHFMGPGGFLKMLRANPNALARALFPKEAAHNPTIFGNRTVGQVEAVLRGMATGAGAARGISSRTSTVNNTTTAHIGVVNINGNGTPQQVAAKFWGAVNNPHKSAVVSHASGLG